MVRVVACSAPARLPIGNAERKAAVEIQHCDHEFAVIGYVSYSQQIPCGLLSVSAWR